MNLDITVNAPQIVIVAVKAQRLLRFKVPWLRSSNGHG
jgi:hypothetical protein